MTEASIALHLHSARWETMLLRMHSKQTEIRFILLIHMALVFSYYCRIQQLIEGGMVEYWKKRSFPQLQCQIGAYAEAKSIMLEDTVGVFLLLAIGILAAVCLLLLEKICSGVLLDDCHGLIKMPCCVLLRYSIFRTVRFSTTKRRE